jgi:hypothetical protein
MRLALSKGPSRVSVLLPSPEDGNRPSYPNVVFSSYLEFETMDKVQKASGSGPALYSFQQHREISLWYGDQSMKLRLLSNVEVNSA